MKINIVGGGPAGLYFAILMKKQDRASEVNLWERNAADDTFGWGVVFSDRTQENLQNADAETHQQITQQFASWDDIDVYFKGDVVRSTGHGFCGMSRKKLLLLLQARAKSLGVNLQYNTEVSDFDSLRNCDLLVAADGVNSRIRLKYAEFFKPSLDVRPNRYTWLGTRQQFEAFTFSFRENEHGLFMLHAYQFEPETSTFIVETSQAAFEAAGLDRADEAETIRYCEEVFAEDLGGHALMGNRSNWIQFVTVKNETWSHENVVLLGDAAHTAHFSVGSGTKLAFEDAIALAEAFASQSDVSGALSAYETERRSGVDSLQRAAQSSLEWFEGAGRYQEFDTQRFVFSLLTRSMRVTHDNLKLRDPEFVRGVDRWFAQETSAEPTPPMFRPYTVGGLELVNRVVVSPMCQYSAEDGMPGDWHLVHLGSRAVGGAALVMTEMTAVSRDARITPGCTGIYSDAHEAAWARITGFVHANSPAKIGIQLGHAGRKGSTKLMWEGYDQPLAEGNWGLLAPSPLPWDKGNQVPKEMNHADMTAVTAAFVESTRRAARAGFDLAEVHLAHGYLLSSFLTPLSNQRTDEYGGSFENRCRFPLEVVRAVRDAWKDKPLSVRISATDWVQGAFDGDDAVRLAEQLKQAGVDLVDVSTGQTSVDSRPQYGRTYQTPFSDRIRNEVGIATIAVGNISTYDDINTIVLAGRADLVALARAHLADPYFVLHAAREQNFTAHPWPRQYESAKRLKFLVS